MSRSGYSDVCEHLELYRAAVDRWYKGGWLKGGMANVAGSGKHQQHRERLWLSPHCLSIEPPDSPQLGLFGGAP